MYEYEYEYSTSTSTCTYRKYYEYNTVRRTVYPYVRRTRTSTVHFSFESVQRTLRPTVRVRVLEYEYEKGTSVRVDYPKLTDITWLTHKIRYSYDYFLYSYRTNTCIRPVSCTRTVRRTAGTY